MKRISQTILVLTIAGISFIAGRAGWGVGSTALAAPPQKGKDAPKKSSTSQKQQQMMAMGEPGEAHKHLELLLGEWEGEMKIWFAPGRPPMTFKASKKRESLFDGRFVIEHVEAPSDMGPFRALQIFGYNNFEKRYEAFYIDNGGTAMATMPGSFDEATTTFTFTGKETDMSGQKVKTRNTVDCSKKDVQIMTGYKPGRDGKEFKSFEVTLTRKK